MATPLPALPLPEGITESYVQSHDLRYHILSAGEAHRPLVLCLHGFPELAFSWRKVMPAIAAQGYRVVAFDQRGYGRTTGWDMRDFSSVDLSSFKFTILVRDAMVLVSALGYKEVACMVGHDFGAMVAAHCAVARPDFFKSTVLMSHPFKGTPTLPFDTVRHPPPPTFTPDIHKALANLPEPRKAYKWYYSTEPAAREMVHPQDSLHTFLRGYFHLKSADWKGNDPRPLKAWEATEIAKMPNYYVMPLKATMREAVALSMAEEDPLEVSRLSARWLSDADLAVYVQEHGRTGFQGSLNWYRNTTDPANSKDLELFAGKKIDVPCLFISGRQDWGTYQEPGAIDRMSEFCTDFHGAKILDGAGHWVQQEQSEKVVELVTEFLSSVDSRR